MPDNGENSPEGKETRMSIQYDIDGYVRNRNSILVYKYHMNVGMEHPMHAFRVFHQNQPVPEVAFV